MQDRASRRGDRDKDPCDRDQDSPSVPRWLAILIALILAIGSIANQWDPLVAFARVTIAFLGFIVFGLGAVVQWVFVSLPAMSPLARVIVDVVTKIVLHLWV